MSDEIEDISDENESTEVSAKVVPSTDVEIIYASEKRESDDDSVGDYVEYDSVIEQFIEKGTKFDYDVEGYKKKRLAFMGYNYETGKWNADPVPLWTHKGARPAEYWLDPIFEQQPWESDKKYQEFLCYATLPPSERTFQNAWDRWWDNNPEKPQDKPTGHYYQLANHWRWKDRAYEIDKTRMMYIQRVWVERALERREDDWDHGTELIKKGMEVIRATPNSKITANVALRFIDLGVDLRRGAIPEIKLDKDEATQFIEQLSPEKRARVIKAIAVEFIENE